MLWFFFLFVWLFNQVVRFIFFASHSLTLLALWYTSMHKHVLYNDRRIVWICFGWQKQNESSTSFSNWGRYFHMCVHTYVCMSVYACVYMYVVYTLPKLSFVIWQVHCYELCILYVVALHWYKFMIEHAQSNTGFKQNRCWTNTQERNKGNQWMVMVVQVHIASPWNVNSSAISIIF